MEQIEMKITKAEFKKSMSKLRIRSVSHEGRIHELQDKSEKLLRMCDREEIGEKLSYMKALGRVFNMKYRQLPGGPVSPRGHKCHQNCRGTLIICARAQAPLGRRNKRKQTSQYVIMTLWEKEKIRILNTDRKAHCLLRNFSTAKVEIRRQGKCLQSAERKYSNLGLCIQKSIFQEEE